MEEVHVSQRPAAAVGPPGRGASPVCMSYLNRGVHGLTFLAFPAMAASCTCLAASFLRRRGPSSTTTRISGFSTSVRWGHHAGPTYTRTTHVSRPRVQPPRRGRRSRTRQTRAQARAVVGLAALPFFTAARTVAHFAVSQATGSSPLGGKSSCLAAATTT